MYPQSSPPSGTPTASSSMAASVHARLSELPHEPKLTPGADQLGTCPTKECSIWTLLGLGHTLKYHLVPQKGGSAEGAKASAFSAYKPQGGGGDAEQRLSPEKEVCHGAPLPGLARKERGSSL